jgi:predicted SnoaL-like aldol condensation-catalyzing enzyme
MVQKRSPETARLATYVRLRTAAFHREPELRASFIATATCGKLVAECTHELIDEQP